MLMLMAFVKPVLINAWPVLQAIIIAKLVTKIESKLWIVVFALMEVMIQVFHSVRNVPINALHVAHQQIIV